MGSGKRVAHFFATLGRHSHKRPNENVPIGLFD